MPNLNGVEPTKTELSLVADAIASWIDPIARKHFRMGLEECAGIIESCPDVHTAASLIRARIKRVRLEENRRGRE